jgi:hypothetical protein
MLDKLDLLKNISLANSCDTPSINAYHSVTLVRITSLRGFPEPYFSRLGSGLEIIWLTESVDGSGGSTESVPAFR